MKKWLVTFLVGLFLVIVIYLVINLSEGKTTFFGKAVVSGVFNPSNSYIFASPLLARTGGDKIRVTIFALDDQGRGIPKKTVEVNCKDLAVCQTAGITFTEVQAATDTLGRAMFDLTAVAAGKYELQAQIGGTPIPQTVTVIFQ